MRLFWSSRSPYVRKVMVAAHELGLAEHLQCVRIRLPLEGSGAELLRLNPLGQIPTLALADGRALYDSLVICEYLDLLGSGPKLVPVLPMERIEVLQRHALAQGLTDLAIRLMGERMRAPALRSEIELQRRQVAIGRVLDELETRAGTFARLAPELGQVAIAAALAYLDFRLGELQWRHGRPVLGGWFETFARRPSMVATAFVDDLAAAAPAPAPAPR